MLSGSESVVLPVGVSLKCHCCGNIATCVGKYESMSDWEPACDDCCGHACEDGICYEIEEQ